MPNNHPYLVITSSFALSLCLAGCGDDGNGAGSSFPICNVGDLSCLLENMELSEFASPGDPSSAVSLPTTPVPSSNIPAPLGQDMNPLAPAITNTPTPLTFTDPEESQGLTLGWDDPNGCRPSFCFSICDRDPGGGLINCTPGSRCTRSVNDGQLNGAINLGIAWRSYYAPLIEDPTPPDTVVLQALPLIGQPAAPGEPCPDTVDMIQSGEGTVFTGVGITVDQTIDQLPPVEEPDNNNNNNQFDEFSDSQCSGFVSGTSCSIQACVAINGSNINCAYFDSHGHRFNCAAGCACTAAATEVVQHCNQ